ncbi:MAG TPA: YaeQ family protein [Candidatus Limnocylindria bacterium]|nr:YaeQ family protein [Candidatus Limnocylindria bacterium]
MALKATIYKARIQLSDLDRNVYGDQAVTIARHPSETDERLLVRLLAFALEAPPGQDEPALELAKDMWEPDEPSLWQKDATGRISHWIDVGQPDEKRLLRTSARVDRLTVYSFASSTPIWWRDLAPRLTRLRNLTVWQIPAEQSQALAAVAQRTMDLQLTVQDGSIWVDDGTHSVEVTRQRLYGPIRD